MDINLCQFVQLRLSHFALLFGDFVLPVRSRVRCVAVIVVDGRRFRFATGCGQDVDAATTALPIAGEVFVIVRLDQAGDPQV